MTSFEFQLHPIDDVYVGLFFYELEHAGDLFRFFREFIKDAPEAYGAFPAFQIAPPLPFIPEDRHGDTFCVAVVHWAGPLEEGEQAMAPFRDLAPVVAEMVGPMPYPWLNGAFDAIFPKGIRSYWKGNFVTELTDAAIEAHVDHGPKVPEVSATMHLYPINGAAIASAPTTPPSPTGTRPSPPSSSPPGRTRADDAERIQWVRDYYEATAPHSEAGRLRQLHGRRRPGARPGQLRRQLPAARRRSSASTTRTTCSTATRTRRRYVPASGGCSVQLHVRARAWFE